MLVTLNHLSARVACHFGIRAGRIDVGPVASRIGAAFGAAMAAQEYHRLAVAHQLYCAASAVDRGMPPTLDIVDSEGLLESPCHCMALPTPFSATRPIRVPSLDQQRGRFAYIPAPQHLPDLCRERIAQSVSQARQHGRRLVMMRYERPGQTRERLVFQPVPPVESEAAWIERRLADTLSLNPALYDWTFGHAETPPEDMYPW